MLFELTQMFSGSQSVGDRIRSLTKICKTVDQVSTSQQLDIFFRETLPTLLNTLNKYPPTNETTKTNTLRKLVFVSFRNLILNPDFSVLIKREKQKQQQQLLINGIIQIVKICLFSLKIENKSNGILSLQVVNLLVSAFPKLLESMFDVYLDIVKVMIKTFIASILTFEIPQQTTFNQQQPQQQQQKQQNQQLLTYNNPNNNNNNNNNSSSSSNNNNHNQNGRLNLENNQKNFLKFLDTPETLSLTRNSIKKIYRKTTQRSIKLKIKQILLDTIPKIFKLEPINIKRNKPFYYEAISIQIKFLKLFFMVHRENSIDDRGEQDTNVRIKTFDKEVVEKVVLLLKTCPSDSIELRRKIIKILTKIAKTEKYIELIKYLDELLDEDILLGTSSQLCLPLVPRAFKFLSLFFHKINLQFTKTQHHQLIIIICKNLHDHLVPIKTQILSPKLTLKILNNFQVQDPDDSLQFLHRLFISFIDKFSILKKK